METRRSRAVRAKDDDLRGRDVVGRPSSPGRARVRMGGRAQGLKVLAALGVGLTLVGGIMLAGSSIGAISPAPTQWAAIGAPSSPLGLSADAPADAEEASSASASTGMVAGPTAGSAPLQAGSAIVPGSVGRTSIDLVATYDVDLALHYGDRSLAATSTMSVTNASGGPIDRLELNTIAARLGHLALGAVTVDGRQVSPTVRDQTILVPLGGILADGATATVRLSFRAALRRDLVGSDWLFTRTNGIIDAYRWLPWVSQRRPFTRPNYGDPFITASSPLVRVRITTDRALVIAATGQRVAATGLSQTFEAHNVRDFTVTASPSFTVHGARVGSTTVSVYAKVGYPVSTVLGYAKSAIAVEGAFVGAYPYPTFSVVQSAGGDGMESPELVWIPGGLSGSHLRWLIFHETAHQWFYGIVGSDQANQPFADEAAADQLARTVTGIWRASHCATGRLDLSIYRYSSACYFEIVYVQGSRFLDGIRARMGSAAYWAALHAYIDAHRFGLGRSRALLDALDAATPLDLRPLFATRFPSLY